VSNAAPPKKKGTIKAKLAEKEAAKRAAVENGENDDLYDEDAVLDPREKARRDRERELKSDLDNAASLLGSSGSKASAWDTSNMTTNPNSFSAAQAPAALLDMNPKTKDEFEEFSQQIMELLIKKHEGLLTSSCISLLHSSHRQTNRSLRLSWKGMYATLRLL
jgi:translation initiation factor 3 subunit J